MWSLVVLLLLLTPSETIHLTEVADIAVAIQHYFCTRGTVLLKTRETCKYNVSKTLSTVLRVLICYKYIGQYPMSVPICVDTTGPRTGVCAPNNRSDIRTLHTD